VTSTAAPWICTPTGSEHEFLFHCVLDSAYCAFICFLLISVSLAAQTVEAQFVFWTDGFLLPSHTCVLRPPFPRLHQHYFNPFAICFTLSCLWCEEGLELLHCPSLWRFSDLCARTISPQSSYELSVCLSLSLSLHLSSMQMPELDMVVFPGFFIFGVHLCRCLPLLTSPSEVSF